MRMTTKLLSLLTILFVFFKFGESAKAMLSISGDKNFLFYNADLQANEVVGFVYEDTNGGVAAASCTEATEATSFTLKADCTVQSSVGVAVATSLIKVDGSTVTTLNGLLLNMMVAQPASTPVAAKTLTELEAVVTVTQVPSIVTLGASATASTSDSSFLCNALSADSTAAYFTYDATPGPTTFGILKSVTAQKDNYPSVTKCVAEVKSSATSGATYGHSAGTFVFIISDHTEIKTYFHMFVLPSVVVLQQSINQTTSASTTVGYINGKDACPSNDNLTFTPTTGSPCTGSIKTTSALKNFPFITFGYGGRNYYLNVTGVNTTTTCSATTNSTATTDSTATAFAFNFKYSKISIGMLLIYLLKMLNSY